MYRVMKAITKRHNSVAVLTCAILFIFSDTVEQLRTPHQQRATANSPTRWNKLIVTTTTMAASYEDMSDSDDDEEECRVCRGPAEEG